MIDFISSYSPSNCWSFLYVPNGSKNYDAALQMTCTDSTEYLNVVNQFDTSSNLLASETRSGKLTVTLKKQYTGDGSLDTTITCTLTATGVERTELDDGVLDITLENDQPIVLISNEEFVYGSNFDLHISDSSNNEKLTHGAYVQVKTADTLLENQIITVQVTDTNLSNYNLTLGYFDEEVLT